MSVCVVTTKLHFRGWKSRPSTKRKIMVGHAYAETFWGADLNSTAGFEALTKRNYEGKKICQEIEDYLKKRSKLESEYSKTLSGLSKCFKTRESGGVLEATLNQFKVEIETMANSHQGAYVFFAQQSDNVKKFREEQSIKKKQKEEAVQKTQSAKLSQLSKTLQLEKSYYKKCTDRDAAVANAKDADAENPPAPQKELDKIRNRAIKAEEEVQKADTLYRSAVIVLEDNRVNWEREMNSLCEACQELDEERIRFLRQEIWTCLNVDSKLSLDIDNSCENVRVNLEKCTVADDTEHFIKIACTGTVRPEKYQYRPYGQKPVPRDNNDPSGTYVDIDSIMRRKSGSQKKK